MTGTMKRVKRGRAGTWEQAAGEKLVALIDAKCKASTQQCGRLKVALEMRAHLQAYPVVPVALADYEVLVSAMEVAVALVGITIDGLTGDEPRDSPAMKLLYAFTRALLQFHGAGDLMRYIGFDPESELLFDLLIEDKYRAARLLRSYCVVDK